MGTKDHSDPGPWRCCQGNTPMKPWPRCPWIPAGPRNKLMRRLTGKETQVELAGRGCLRHNQ